MKPTWCTIFLNMFLFSTCFGRLCARHHEIQLCLCDIWYLLFCMDDCLVCRVEYFSRPEHDMILNTALSRSSYGTLLVTWRNVCSVCYKFRYLYCFVTTQIVTFASYWIESAMKILDSTCTTLHDQTASVLR
jgi:hypothetical protein